MKLDLALVHYPVLDKNREIIGSAVTNLDLHDLARAGKTYGVRTLHIVTPFGDQQRLVNEICAHWCQGHGASYNPLRREAISILKVSESLDVLFKDYRRQGEERPLTLATSAKGGAGTLGYGDLRQRLASGEHCLIVFGTGWGLAPAVMEMVDAVLPPIAGTSAYNHLSVRAACAIILDRLLGEREEILV